METLRIGIVGCGGIANGKHMPALKTVEGVEMVAFCDIILERAEKAAKEYGAEGSKVYENYKDLLAREDIDVVHVLTPNISHAEISIAAMEAGKHVMCEKPMAKTVAEAEAMYEAHKRTGKLLSIGYNGRSGSSQQYAKQLIEEGVLGDIYYVRAKAVRRRGVPCWGVFTDKEKQGGGPLIDIATHSVDAVMWLTNNYEVESVTGTTFQKLAKTVHAANDEGWGTWEPDEYDVEDSSFAFIRFKNGMVVSLECSWMLNIADDQIGSMALCGSKAGMDFADGLRVNGELHGATYVNKFKVPNHIRPRVWSKTMTDTQYDAWQWIEAVRGNAEPLVKPEQALMVSRVLEAIYTSSETGKTIYF